MDSQSSPSNAGTRDSSATSSNNSDLSDQQQPVDSSNLIRNFLVKGLDSDSFSKFTQVLDYVGSKHYEPLYETYNTNLLAQLKSFTISMKKMDFQLPEGYTFEQHTHRKANFFAFRFISNIAKLLLHKIKESGEAVNERTEKNYIILTKILLNHALLSKNDSANLALVELYELIKFQNITPQALYHKHKAKFLRLIIKAILVKLKNNGDITINGNGSNTNGNPNCAPVSLKRNPVATYMTRALEVFNVYTIKRDDVAQTLLIIAMLAHKDTYDESIKLFLDNLASYQNIDKWSLLNLHIQAITVGLLLSKKLSLFDIGASLEKLALFCDKKVEEIFQRKISFIKAELLLHYSTDTTSVAHALCYLAQFEKKSHQQPFRNEFEDPQRFIRYLSPDMVGILLGVDSYITSPKEFTIQDRIMHVVSLSKLISMLEPLHVEAIHHKLLSTLQLFLSLRTTRDNEDLNIALKILWEVFVTKLSKELRRSLFLNICISLVELLEDCSEVAIIYAKLFQEDIKSLENEFKHLFFIPKIPSMQTIYEHITPHIPKYTMLKNINELNLSLDSVFPLMKLESYKARLLGLKQLRRIIKSNQNALLYTMTTNRDEPLTGPLSKTIELLISLSSVQESELINLIAECLGMLGAVNPIRLDHLIYGHLDKTEKTRYTPLLSNEFKVELIEKLKVSLFSDRINESESANYAIQVVMRHSPFFETTIKPKLSEAALRACSLCEKTLYGGYKKPPTDVTTSVYEKLKFENQHSYKDWLEKFSWNLIATIKSQNEREILEACSYVFKYNSKFAEYLLPHAVTYIIVNQNQQVEMIRREVMAILGENVGASTQDLDNVYTLDSGISAQSLHLQCANMMFYCLDACHRIQHDFRKPGTKVKLMNVVHIKEFNDSIPKDKLAILASRCRSHARTVYYFDQFLANNKNQFDKYATELQRALVGLDDTYEASGVQMVRNSPPTIMDDISKHEAFGRYDKAFLFCDILLENIETTPNPEFVIDNSLRCLSNQGDIKRLYEQSKSMIESCPQYKRSILPYAIEATWKLSRWDELEYTFKNEQVDSLLELSNVSQAYLLLNTLNTPERIPETLKIVRNKLMKPLSIAIMDHSAYFRGYQSLVILHSIGDFTLYEDIFSQFSVQRMDENTIDSMRVELCKRLDILFRAWNNRNYLVEPTIKTLEPLRMWHRSIMNAIAKKYPFLQQRLNIDIGIMWLSSADSSREAKNFDHSFYAIAQAKRWFGSEFDSLNLDLRIKFHLQEAKLDWELGEKTKAIRGLKLCLEMFKDNKLLQHLQKRRTTAANQTTTDSFPMLNDLVPCSQCDQIKTTERESFVTLKLLLTQYCDEAAASIPETLFFMYEECVHLGVFQEETYFRLARYYDKLLSYYIDNPKLFDEPVDEKNPQEQTQKFSQSLRSGDKEDVCTKLMEHSIMAFGNSMKYGACYLRESMPRMLTLWYDLGSKKTRTNQSRAISSRIESTVRFIDELKKAIPAYYFMTATSLILSRICHPHSGVSKKTCEIIELLLINYPHQMTWLMVAVMNDKDNASRNKSANFIINGMKKKNMPQVEKVINDTLKFVQIISDLTIRFSCKDPSVKDRKKRPTGMIDIETICPAASRQDFTAIKVIVPIHDSMRAILPMGNSGSGNSNNSNNNSNNANTRSCNVFPGNEDFCIASFIRGVRLYNSLQQPKSVSMRCRNGKVVSVLLKAGDDLRKDSRCTEFLDLLNKILRRNNQSNARFVEIKTFLVLPLEAEMGIIEMVPDCEPVRGLLEKLYRERKSDFNISMTLPKRGRDYSPQEILEKFKSELLPKTTPAALPTWFLRNFPEPTSWYMARLAFTRSTAVVSMGGYIIGLGDRHLDNILLDTNTGGIVHVDFNLLFHQGELLPTPERVPFRLTHNIVAAFGPVGTEGNFRKVCEIAMGVMRKEKDALLTTLKPFLFDPCSEWVKVRDTRGAYKANEPEERHGENRVAKERLDVIEKKLRGFPRSQKFKPLTFIDSYSVSAQVDNLIEEASDMFNLAQMYFGWCPQI